MVLINDDFDFEVYSWDTDQNIVNRLAARLDTLPKYLYLPPGTNPDIFMKKLRKKEVTEINDYLSYMKEQQPMALPTILSQLSGAEPPVFLVSERLDLMKDIISPFIAYNSQLEKLRPEQVRPILYLLKTSIKGIVVPTELLWNKRERDATKKRITEGIELNKKVVEEGQILVRIKSLPHTPFIRDEVALRLEIDFKNLTLLEIFDHIVLTPSVPFASVNNLYKILRNFTPDPEWGASSGSIYLKILEFSSSDLPEYISAVLILSGGVGEETGTIQTSLIRLKKGGNEKRFLEDLQGIFPRLPLVKTGQEIVREKGRLYYLLGKEPLDSYIFGDLVMNDPLFRQYLVIDESDTATKKKRSSLYIHFCGGSDEMNVKVNLTVYRTRDKDDVHRKHGYKLGEYYLNVLVSDVKSASALNDFITIFGKLLRLYYQKVPALTKLYQDLLSPDPFPPEYQGRAVVAPGKKKGEPLSKIAPGVFVSGYPTKCTHQPRVVSEEEALEAKRAGSVAMQYPKTQNEGFPRRWYLCDQDSAYPYPGLRSNELQNSDIVPYLPCCFKIKQDWGPEGKKGAHPKAYDNYFYDKPLAGRGGGVQQQLSKRDVFMRSGHYATLPPELDQMLDLVVHKPDWSFVRSGVTDSRSSFLECILEALQTRPGGCSDTIAKILEREGVETQKAKLKYEEAVSSKDKPAQARARDAYKKTLAKERCKLLANIRKGLATPRGAASCSQEMYDYNQDEKLQVIGDQDLYFDPRLVLNLVERVYGCRIIIFSRVIPGYGNSIKYQGSFHSAMVLPRHKQAYYRTQKEVPTILIYERVGRGGEQRDYPRCELIAHWEPVEKKVIFVHESGSVISKDMREMYERLRKSYTLNCPVPETIFSLDRLKEVGLEPISQEIDSYGKCRAIILTYKEQTGVLLTSPIQPMLLPRFAGAVTPRFSLETVEEILSEIKTINDATGLKRIQVPDRETFTGLQVSGYSGILGNVRFSLPFKDWKDHQLIPKLDPEEDLFSRGRADSKLQSFIQYKKLARYMIEYMRWMYSAFLNDKGLDASLENLKVFVDTHVTIDKEFKYGHVAKTFSLDSGVTDEKGNLCIKSLESMKRLIYTLQLFATQHPVELKEYYHRSSISNYYLNVGDFTRYRSQVILQGDGAVLKWIRERGQDYSLHRGIISNNRKGLTTPYFFKNRLVDDKKMYLAQGAKQLEQALTISVDWSKGVNKARAVNEGEVPEILIEDFTIYSYRNPTNIEPYVCNEGCREGEEDGIKILGYKDGESNATYVSLLPLPACRR
jgi:hypothetical protein